MFNLGLQLFPFFPAAAFWVCNPHQHCLALPFRVRLEHLFKCKNLQINTLEYVHIIHTKQRQSSG